MGTKGGLLALVKAYTCLLWRFLVPFEHSQASQSPPTPPTAQRQRTLLVLRRRRREEALLLEVDAVHPHGAEEPLRQLGLVLPLDDKGEVDDERRLGGQAQRDRWRWCGLWLRCHGLSVGSETLGLLSRVRRAASSLRVQPDEPVVASYGPGKAATLSCAVHLLLQLRGARVVRLLAHLQRRG